MYNFNDKNTCDNMYTLENLHSYIVNNIGIQVCFQIEINPYHKYNHPHQIPTSPLINLHKEA